MSEAPPKQVLMTVHNLLRRGERSQAGSLLRILYEDYPNSPDVLYLMIFLAEDPLRMLNLCQKILRIDPTHEPTLKLLRKLNTRNQAEPSPSAPHIQSVAEPGSILAEDEPYFTSIKRPRRLRRLLLLLLAIALIVLAVVVIQPAGIAQLLSRSGQPPATDNPVFTLAATAAAAQASAAPTTATLLPATSTTASASRVTEPASVATSDSGTLPTMTPGDAAPLLATPIIADAPDVLNAPIQPLPGHIRDAAYSISLKRLVVIADLPPVLYSYEFANQRMLRIDLPREPIRLAISTDGRSALITHHGLISYVELPTLTVARTLQLPQIVHALTLAADGWGYMLIGFDTNQLALLSVNFSTGQSHLDPVESPITRPGVMRLTPGADRLYFAPAANSTDALQAIAIRGGKPDRRLVLPVGGTPATSCENVWLPDDGARIFTACGSVLTPALDPVGTLDGVTSAAGVELFPRSKLIAALAQFATTGGAGGRIPVKVRSFAEIALFDSATFSQLSRRVLPSFPGDSAPAIGRRLLADPDTGQLLVLVQRPQADVARPADDWGIVAVTVDPVSASLLPVQALKLPDSFGDSSTAVPASDIAALPVQPVEVAYSRGVERLVFAVKEPASLQVFDPATQSAITVPLPMPPVALALSPDGLLAAVGHESAITLVDLGTRRVLRAVNTDHAVTAIALTADGWIITPRALIDSATGAQSDSPGGDVLRVSADGRLVYLHDPVAHIYGSGKLRRGTVTSSWTEDAAFAPGEDQGVLRTCNNFWLTEDDAWIVTACGEIWQQATPPLYYSALDSIEGVGAFAHSRTAGVLLAASSSGVLTLYDAGTFRLTERLLLPSLTEGATVIPLRAWRIFFSADGSTYYVLVTKVDNTQEPFYGLLTRRVGG